MAVSTIETYSGLFREVARRRPDADSVVFPDQRRTYAELLAGAEQRARELRALGVGSGHRFGVLMPNAPEIVELLIAAGIVGATIVPINTRFKPRELAYLIGNAELTALYTTDVIDEHVNFKTLLSEALPGLADAKDPANLSLEAVPHLRAVVLLSDNHAPGFLDASALRARAVNEPETAPDAAEPDGIALLLYTSGTTAHPKGCMLSHRALTNDAYGIAERFAIPPEDVWWNPLPMFHAGGIMLMSGCFVAGATFISTPRFDPDEAFDIIERERPTVLYPLFPTMTLTLMHHERFATVSRERLRVVVNVGPDDIQRQIQDAFAPAKLMSAYGITELCGTLVFTELDDPVEARVQTCGRPLPGFDLRVVDPQTNAELPAGERGELVGRGISRFAGYYNNPEATREAVDAEGFFHTGDLCSIDADGRIRYHGRIKDMLKVGGENVAAVEIESFLATHPAIKLAQVVGVPDARLIEIPAAFVELTSGSHVTEAEVIEYCKGQIAGFKVPRYVRFVTEWPMSATKIQKFRLRSQLLEELGIGSS